MNDIVEVHKNVTSSGTGSCHAKYSLLHPDRSGALGRPSLDELAKELGAAGDMEISASWGIINND
jgi:hypothetical protein